MVNRYPASKFCRKYGKITFPRLHGKMYHGIMRACCLLLFLETVHTVSHAQNNKNRHFSATVDSLEKKLKNQPDDTGKLSTLNALSAKLKELGYPDSSLVFDKKARGLAREIEADNHSAKAMNGIGNTYFQQGNYPVALEYYFKALTIARQTDNKKDITAALGNLGNIYCKQGNYPQALEYYFKALTLAQEIGNKRSMASHLSNLGIVYEEQGNYTQALQYDLKSLNIAGEIGDKYITSHSLDNLGVLYDKQGDYAKALQYEFKALAIGMQIGNNDNLIDIGNIYADQGNYQQALEYYSKALSAARKMADKDAVANLYSNIGGVYTKLKNYKQAKTFLDSALTLSKKVGDKIYIKDTYHALTILDSATGKYRTSYEDYEKYIVYRDSLINQESVKKITQMELSYRFEKREDSIIGEQEKNNIIKAAEIKRKNITTYSAIVISVLTLLLAILLINRQQIKRRQDKIIFEKEKERMEDELANAKNMLDEYIKNMVEKNSLIEQFRLDMEEFKMLKTQKVDEKRIEYLDDLNKATILTEEDWDKFKKLFEQVYKGFFIRLKEKLPDLTQAETRLICLTKLKVDTKHMGAILGVSFDTIKKSRHRLRKKLGLSEEDTIDDIANSI